MRGASPGAGRSDIRFGKERWMPQHAYDALDTVNWMLAEAGRELASETTTDAAGRKRRKSKAQREREEVRFATLCEVIWNVSGRTDPLEAVTERARGQALGDAG
jgi:hypothetical protein